MSQKDLEKALDECLSATDPEAVAAMYPELETELLPLIRTAEQIRKTPLAVPSPRPKAATLERLLMRLKLKRQNRQAQKGLLEAA